MKLIDSINNQAGAAMPEYLSLFSGIVLIILLALPSFTFKTAEKLCAGASVIRMEQAVKRFDSWDDGVYFYFYNEGPIADNGCMVKVIVGGVVKKIVLWQTF